MGKRTKKERVKERKDKKDKAIIMKDRMNDLKYKVNFNIVFEKYLSSELRKALDYAMLGKAISLKKGADDTFENL